MTRKIHTTQFEQALLCVLFAADPKACTIQEILKELTGDLDQQKVLWSLLALQNIKFVERDGNSWKLSDLGKQHWTALVTSAMDKLTNLQRMAETFKLGTHVRIGPSKPDGAPHPHAGKTGVIEEIMGIHTGLFTPRAHVRVDPGIEPQGIIVVSLQCLELAKPN